MNRAVPAKTVLIIDSSDTAVGRLGSDLATAAASVGTQVQVLLRSDIRRNPLRSAVRIAEAKTVHFLDSRMYVEFGSNLIGKEWISTIHHLSESESWKLGCLGAGTTVVTDRFTYAKVVGFTRNVVRMSTGVAEGVFEPLPSALRILKRQEFGLLQNELLIGALSKASGSRKNQKLLFEIIQATISKSTNVRFILAGSGWSGLPRNVASRVKVLSPKLTNDQLRDFYASLDVFISHSDIEGGPLPVIESLACGTRVVSTDVGQVRDWFEKLDEPGDIVVGRPDEFVEKIFECGTTGEVDREERSLQVYRNFGYQVLIKDYLELWETANSESLSWGLIRKKFRALVLLGEWLLSWSGRRLNSILARRR